MFVFEPGEEPLSCSRPQMQRTVDDSGGPGLPDRTKCRIEVLVGIGELRQDRHHEHRDVEAEFGGGAHGGQSRLRRRGAGFEALLQSVVMDGDRHADLDRSVLGDPRQKRQIATQEGALGQDRQRRRPFGQGGDDPGHEAVASLCPLIGIGVRAQCDMLVGPFRPRQLRGEHLGDVDLDDDLAIEVGAGVEVEVAMGAAGEAVDAGV